MKFFKEHLAESAIKNICPIGDTIMELKNNFELIEEVLMSGQAKAFDEAEKNLLEFKDAMNLLV